MSDFTVVCGTKSLDLCRDTGTRYMKRNISLLLDNYFSTVYVLKLMKGLPIFQRSKFFPCSSKLWGCPFFLFGLYFYIDTRTMQLSHMLWLFYLLWRCRWTTLLSCPAACSPGLRSSVNRENSRSSWAPFSDRWRLAGSVGDPWHLVLTRIRGSVPLWLIIFRDFKDAKQLIFFIFFSYNLPAGTLSLVLKIVLKFYFVSIISVRSTPLWV